MLSECGKLILCHLVAAEHMPEDARQEMLTIGPVKTLDLLILRGRAWAHTHPSIATAVVDWEANRQETERLIAGYLGMM